MIRDVIVIGNGVIGMAIAGRIRRESGARVTLVGPRARPNGASAAAGAMLGCLSEVTKDTFASAAGTSRFELSWRAHRMWPRFIEELQADSDGDPLRRDTDTFVLLNSCGGELDSLNFEAIAAAASNRADDWDFVEPSVIPGYNPRPSGRALRAIRVGNEGAVDARRLIGYLEGWLQRTGVECVQGHVEEFVVSDDAVTGVRLRGGDSVVANVVIVAAGAESTRLLHSVTESARLLPVLTGLGAAIVGRRTVGTGIPGVVRTPNRGGACGLHVVPLASDIDYIGATNRLLASPAGNANIVSLHSLAEQAMHQVDEQIAWHEVLEIRAGSRPVSLDGFPLIGWTGLPGLYIVSGTYRDGLHAAPALAEIVSAEVLTGERSTSIEAFSPTRRPIETRSVTEALDEYALHLSSSTFELGGVLPRPASTGSLVESHRAEAAALYEATRISVALPPEIVEFLAHPIDVSTTTTIVRYLRSL